MLQEKIGCYKENLTLEAKLCRLEEEEEVKNFLTENRVLCSSFSLNEKVILYSLVFLKQWKTLFPTATFSKKNLVSLIRSLIPVETFYADIGGLIGYHFTCLELCAQKEEKEKKGNYFSPRPYDLSVSDAFRQQAAAKGLEHLNEVAELYPIGGAADRLSYQSKNTPFQIAATFEFCGKSLLERLVEDLQAREFLYYQQFHKQIHVPIVMMTSDEKKGTRQIQQMLKEKNWFGRRREDFFIFAQPLVPAMTRKGVWCATGPGSLLMKPGGHGVIWKLAKESGALQFLQDCGKTKLLVRQINNPVAGVDDGLLAFLGIGFEQDKTFGFASCPCAGGVSEGVNVVIEKKEGKCLTNIEYCDFEHFQIDCNTPSLLANTNLLFVDILSIEQLLKVAPIPGLLVNAKKIKYQIEEGIVQEEEVMRLESTMQNLADALVEEGDPREGMRFSYITTNVREKTISSIKKEFAFGSSMLQTPEQCYLDMLKNARDLLVNYCQFEVPILRDPMEFFKKGPSFIFLYHPALGPLYSVIQSKLHRGKLALESEWLLDVADSRCENLEIEGSFHILSDAIMGHKDEKGVIQYGPEAAKCRLKNVKVFNQGIHRESSGSFWKDEVVHKERCVIWIEEGGEFVAEDVTFLGDVQIRVPKNTKVIASMEGDEVILYEKPGHYTQTT